MNDLLKELSEIQSSAQMRADYHKTLALLRALKAGTVLLDNVTMTADGWNVVVVVESTNPASEEKQTEPEAA